MSDPGKRLRVLYSFPHKLGGGRINTTAWYQVTGLAAAGAEVIVHPAAVKVPVPESITVRPTLARGKLRVPFRLLGHLRAFELHDYIVSRRLQMCAHEVDIVHTWPLGALRTLKIAARLGIPTTLERPNAHTRYAYEIVQKECEALRVDLPKGHEHAYNPDVLSREEQEYELAYRLLCPSEFVVKTFLQENFAPEKLARHVYGYDERYYFPGGDPKPSGDGLTVLFAGVCAVRKGLHYALQAWLDSPASQRGRFLIAGDFIPDYRERLSPMLSHPSVQVLGFRTDVAELMRTSDVLILPTIEEGSALVTAEARASGCVLVVSKASGAVCQHMQNALVHEVGDVPALTQHITWLDQDRALLKRLRAASLATVHEISWAAAGVTLLDVYRETIKSYRLAMSADRLREEAETSCCKLSKARS